LSNIRATAKAADLYNAAKAKLIAEGKYNPDLEKQTGTYLDDWDSAKQGAFTATSPNSLQTIQELVLPTINELQQSYRYDDALTKQRHDGYRYSTVSNQRVTEALNGNYMDLMNKPSMQYYKNRFMAQNPNATEQDFKNMIFKQVRSQLGEKTEKDDLFFANLDYQHKLALQRQAQSTQRALAEVKGRYKKSGGNNQTLYLSNRLGYRAAAQTALDLSPAMSAGKLSAYWEQKASDEKDKDVKKKYENYSKLWSGFNKMSEKEQTKMLETYGLAKNGQLTSKYEKLVSAASGVGATGFKTIQKDGSTYRLNSVASGTAKAI